MRKNDSDVLMKMILDAKPRQGEVPHYFLKALVMGHNVMWSKPFSGLLKTGRTFLQLAYALCGLK